MADVLKFPAKRGRPPILVWDDKDVGPPVHDARGRGPPRVHGAVPLGVLRPRARGMEDSPLFVAIWYTLATGLMATAGRLIGRYALRW